MVLNSVVIITWNNLNDQLTQLAAHKSQAKVIVCFDEVDHVLIKHKFTICRPDGKPFDFIKSESFSDQNIKLNDQIDCQLRFNLAPCKKIYKVTGMSAVFTDKHSQIIRAIMPDSVKNTVRLQLGHLANNEPCKYEYEKIVDNTNKELTVMKIAMEKMRIGPVLCIDRGLNKGKDSWIQAQPEFKDKCSVIKEFSTSQFGAIKQVLTEIEGKTNDWIIHIPATDALGVNVKTKKPAFVIVIDNPRHYEEAM